MPGQKKIAILLFICTIFVFFSCRSVRIPVPEETVSRKIAAMGIKSPEQLTDFFMDSRPDADRTVVLRLARYYVGECSDEGINSDIAFAQMCLETGFLRFGNLVTADMHNYCGLGSIDTAHPGERFETEELGVRAHVQHLQAYGIKDKPLVHPAVDRRYKYVQPRGKAPTVFQLSGTWASDRQYGIKLDTLLSRLEKF